MGRFVVSFDGVLLYKPSYLCGNCFILPLMCFSGRLLSFSSAIVLTPMFFFFKFVGW